MLDSRAVGDLTSICPAAYIVGETVTGSGVLCRITGRLVTTGQNPASLRAFCCNPIPAQRDESVDGEDVRHGYQYCPVWAHNRQVELQEDLDLPSDAPQRVKDAMRPVLITRA